MKRLIFTLCFGVLALLFCAGCTDADATTSTATTTTEDCTCKLKVDDPEMFPGTMCPKDYLSVGTTKDEVQCRKLNQTCFCVIPVEERMSGFLPIELPEMNAATPGTIFTTENIKNPVVVVETYFNTCPYCNKNAAAVDALYNSYKNTDRVIVLDVGIDRNDSDYASWISKHHPNHPVLKDAKRQLVKKLGTTSYPSTYVLNCHGDVVAKTVGQWSSSERQTIENGIQAALATVCE